MVDLESWAQYGWLRRHQSSPAELRTLLTAADNDLTNAGLGLSPAWQYTIAYTAALRLCSVAPHASGFRATRDQKHYRTIAALPLILGPEAAELAGYLNKCRTIRHQIAYDGIDSVAQSQAEELIVAVRDLRTRVWEWLTDRRPDYVS